MSRPLRILMMCPQFRPLVGGYERAAERLSKGLVARGQQVDVLTERRDPSWPAREDMDGVGVIRVRSIARRGVHGPSAVFSFARFLMRHGHRYDLIHSHQYGRLAAAAIGYAWLRGVPSLLKITNTGADGIDAALAGSLTERAFRPIHRRVSACITTSGRAAEEARLFGIPDSRIHRIPNPLDTDRFRPAPPEQRLRARADLGIGDEFLAVSVSRLSREKNHAMLIDAWERVAARHPEARLAVVGGGPLQDEIRSRIDGSPATDRIRLVGAVDDPRQWYAAADLFVLPSVNEGLSNSLMEAMSCGLPAVSTQVSGAEDIFAEADIGRMVEPGDAGAFADAVCASISSEAALAESGRVARGYAEGRFAIDRVVDATLALYSKVVEEARAPGSA